MILLWGLADDPPLTLVRECLDQRGAPVLFLDQADVLSHEIEVTYGPEPHGTLWVNGEPLSLESISGIYLRPYDLRDFPDFAGLGMDSPPWQHALRFEDIFWGFADIAPAVVVNRPASMLSNNSKPYQCDIIRSHGFLTPPTLVTTDREAVATHERRWKTMIYKSISGQRSIVQSLSADDHDRLGDVRWCPTQFQQLIPGTDYRVHVVGSRSFGMRVDSEAVDYRYHIARLEPTTLPEPIVRRCMALTAHLGLYVSGIDLRRTPGGEWYCFEVNPSPAFSCYEQPGTPSVAASIADLLERKMELIMKAVHTAQL